MFKQLITESMSKSPWLFHINAGSCNGCDIEIVAVLTPRYDAERLGFKLAGSPRQADIVLVTGPVTKQSLPRVLRAISQVPEPRVIVTMGSCPQSGNVFRGRPSEQICGCRCGHRRLRPEARGSHRRPGQGHGYSLREACRHVQKGSQKGPGRAGSGSKGRS